MKIFISILTFFLTFPTLAQLDVQIKEGDRSVCSGEALQFSDSIVIGSPTSYEWISSIATFTNVNSSSTSASFSGSGDVILKTQDGTTTFYDTIVVTVHANPVIQLGSDAEVCCDYGIIPLNLSVVQTPNFSYGSWTCTQYPNLVQNDLLSTDSVCTKIPSGAKSIKLYTSYTYQDPTTGCSVSDSIKIEVNKLPNLVLEIRQYCQDIGSINLDADLVMSPVNTFAGTPSWRCLDSNATYNKFFDNMLENRGTSLVPSYWLNLDKSNYSIVNQQKDTIVLEFTYTNASGCKNIDTVWLAVWRVPVITFSSNRDLCWDEGKISLNSLTGVNLSDGVWTIYDSSGFEIPNNLGSLNKDTINTLNSIRDGNSHSWLIRYNHIATGCIGWNDTVLTIIPAPPLNLTPLVPNQICETEVNIALEASPTGGIWSAQDLDALVNGDSLSPSNATIQSTEKKLFYEYTSPITGCRGKDSIAYQIDPAPVFTLFPSDTVVCRKPTSSSRNVQFKFATQNSPFMSWFEFSNQMTITPLTNGQGTATFSSLVNAKDSFSIIASALGSASCNDIEQIFSVVIEEDSSCILSVNQFEESSTVVYPNPSFGVFQVTDDFVVVNCYSSIGQKTAIERVGNTSYKIEVQGVYSLLLNNPKTGQWAYKKLIVE